MEIEVMKILAAAVVMGMGTLTTALAIGKIGHGAVEGTSRNPESHQKILPQMILSIAFAEAIAIYALIVALIILFVA